MKETDLTEETKQEIKTQIEYYLGDENLKKDSFFHQIISSDPNGYIDLDLILKCNKIKRKQWTKEDLIKGIELSNFVELDETKRKVRRKNNLKLPELTLLKQKRKKEQKKEVDKKEEPKENKKKKTCDEPIKLDRKNITILKITSAEDTSSIYWKTIFAEFKKLNPELNVDYGRFKDKQGHIGIILKEGQNMENIQLTPNFKIEGKQFNVQKCEGEDLINFWNEHGSHYEYCINQREKNNKSKENRIKNKKYLETKIILGGKEFSNKDSIRNESKKIMKKYNNGEKLKNEDKDFLIDLLKYHPNYEEKIKNMDYICINRNEKFKFTRCFYIVDKNGNKSDFSTVKCIDNIFDKSIEKEDKK